MGVAPFFTTSDYLVMANNLANAANMEVFKNANSTLAVDSRDWDDEQNPVHEKDPDTNLRKLNKQAHDFKNVFIYTEEPPKFLVKDLDLIDLADARAQKYLDLAVDNEKNAMSVKDLQKAQSGVAKSYSFDDVGSMLATFAKGAERFEVQAIRFAGEMMGETGEATVAYPDNFDVRDFNQRLEFIKGLQAVKLPSPTGLKEAFKTLTPEITQVKEIQAAINKEIDAVPEEKPPIIPVVPPTAKGE